MKLLLPNRYQDISDKPVLFLGGPILGAYEWRPKVLHRLMDEDIYAISPQQDLPDFIIANSVGILNPLSCQLGWKRQYLREVKKRKTAPKGVIMFWLQGVNEGDFSKYALSKYARNTRRELGQLDGWLDCDKEIPFVIGGEETFPGIDIVKRCFREHFPSIDFPPTLEETCDIALSKLK